MVKLAINTYFRESRDYGLLEIYADMPEEVAFELAQSENGAIWNQLVDGIRSNVSKEDMDVITDALYKCVPSNPKPLAKYITIDVPNVVPKGFLSPEEDYAQTTERFETPFSFDVDGLLKDVKAGTF